MDWLGESLGLVERGRFVYFFSLASQGFLLFFPCFSLPDRIFFYIMSSTSQTKARRIAVLGSTAVGKRVLAKRDSSCADQYLFCAFFYIGKSSLVIQFCENHFVDSYYPTIENTFTKTIKYRGHGKYRRLRKKNAYLWASLLFF